MKKASTIVKGAVSMENAIKLVLIVIAMAALEAVGYGPTGLLTKYRAWRAAQR